MKNLKLYWFLIIYFCFNAIQAGQLNIKLTPYKEIKDGFYAIGVKRHESNFRYVEEYGELFFSEDGNFSIELPQGRYVLAMLHPSSSIVYYHAFLKDDDATVELNVKMDQAAIPEKIDSIRIVGDFNNWGRPAPKLVNDARKKVWYLPEDALNAHIGLYQFLINDDKRMHKLGKPTGKLNTWCNIANINDRKDNKITFVPSDYKIGNAKPLISGSGTDPDYHALCENFYKMASILRDSMYAIDKDMDLERYKNLYTEQLKIFGSLETKYAQQYPWAFPEQKAVLLNYSLIDAEMRLAWRKDNSNLARQLQNSDAYLEKLKKKYSIINDVRLNDLELNTTIISMISDARYEMETYDLYAELNIPYGKFMQFEDDILAVSKNADICSSILLSKSRRVRNRPVKAKEFLTAIKENYPGANLVKSGRVDTYLKEYTIISGTKCPDFTMVSLKGDEICLSKLKGKYVFLDFWGSWCSPCVDEIPNVKKLAKEFPEDELIVIGIVCHDRKEKAEAFIAENEVTYPNIFGDEKIMGSFGVAKFPTTFLIDKEGMILAKDLRGTNLSEQVKSMMK